MIYDTNNIAIVQSKHYRSGQISDILKSFICPVEPENADIIVIIGGDGEFLRGLHQYMHLNIPFYGINTGTIGFLMNDFYKESFLYDLQNAKSTYLYPLEIIAKDTSNNIYHSLAINDIVMSRQSNQTAKIVISIDNSVVMQELFADGILVATSAGSSAYNLSAGGHIVPIESKLLCITPICPFRPRRWKGALISNKLVINLKNLEPEKRPTSVVADFKEFLDIKEVSISSNSLKYIELLFNPNFSFETKIMQEQFKL
ncbi:NAD kinase [Rickettsia endosymbiont of Cardiosporidium cionae]|uniref:NAD kinase n=1 Tax=Rickettsia endosymbiont of Cardiosporidium cionae TaxID=2777155 RepID=UPI0018959DA0|nr:NAD kinase [Rickettsia endosymbiont of Cardiosporidium cionae]KAF8818949.1 NAD(+) kinase [Rickettsia endosymbiont of Cardiosporidium cionae]